jgi:DNA modification methylase
MFNDKGVWLMQGDCLERMKDIPSGSVDMILTDPPYGTTACKWDSIIPLEPMWEQLKRIIKPNGAIVMTASQPFTTTLISSNMKMFKYCWVWEKEQGTGFANAKKMPLKSHEDVVVFYANPPKYSPQGLVPCSRIRRHSENDVGRALGANGLHGKTFMQEFSNYPKSVIRFSRDRNKDHPTQKPVALMEYLIKTYTNEGETVLDFTMGSGTTGVACSNTGRKFIGIELDLNYFNIALERIEAAHGL